MESKCTPRLGNLRLARQIETLRLGERHRMKTDSVAGSQLGNEREIDGRYLPDARIATGCLAVSHQDDRIAPWRQLHRAERHSFRQQLAPLMRGERWPLEP